MVGTQKIVKTFSKILLSSALYPEPKFIKILFLRKVVALLLQFFYMQLLDCHAIYHWKQWRIQGGKSGHGTPIEVGNGVWPPRGQKE